MGKCGKLQLAVPFTSEQSPCPSRQLVYHKAEMVIFFYLCQQDDPTSGENIRKRWLTLI